MHARLLAVVIVLAVSTPGAASMHDREEVARFIIGYGPEIPQLPPGVVLLAHAPEVRALVVATSGANALLASARADPSIRYVLRDDPTAAHAAWSPNDPAFAGMKNLARIDAPGAWDIERGASAISICVVDTGVRATHEDLAGARYLGGIDLINHDLDPADDQGHGTHVAGTMAATTDNGVGVAGIAQVSLRAAKVLDARGSGSWANVALGIIWCSHAGSHIISLSLTGATSSPILEEAVDYAVDRGALLVAAAGNLARCQDCVMYPARLPQVIAVGCWSANEAPCESGSAGGPELELTAPGENILAPSAWSDDAYATLTGTSMATAHVSGVAALAWSAAPAMSAYGIRALLTCSAEDVGVAGFDVQTGHGLLDARASIAAAARGACAGSLVS